MMTSKETSRVAYVDNFLKGLTPDVRERVEKLRAIQEDCDVVKKDFVKERKELEEKYRQRFDPLFQARSELVAGSGEFPETCQQPGLVPGFWLKVLKSADIVGENVSKRDEPILMYLLDIGHEPIEDNKPGFKLVFKFAKNPYFTPLILEKKYFMGGDDESQLEKAEGTAIRWNENKNPAFKIVKKAGKAGESAKTETIQKHSFFDFFSAPAIPEIDNPDDTADILELLTEDDLELGCCIKEMLLPSAVSWYTGEIGVDALIKEGSSSSGSEDYDDDDDDDESADDGL